MVLGEQIHGFTVDRIRPVGNTGATLVEMSHNKTGARLLWMNNGEDNKLFSIAFKTIPSDDTGVFHILEHSVLGGSKRYPVKEPFLELMKSSMNTFLNAMTYPDKTVFPVSSRNDMDFMNLTRVYLDGVFCPAIYENPCIFEQEGWHIELRDAADTPVYKGVVFNEMKGAMSSVYRRIETEMNKLLFPDSCYRFESGGDPAAIPDLTYERFTELHRYFYHPSNAYIYLDGAVDIDAVLTLLDTEYLSCYGHSDNWYDIAYQPQIATVLRRCEYEISPDEPLANRTHLACGKVLGSFEERERIFAAYVLREALTGSNDAPLKRALLDTGLCLDVSLDVNNGILQPFGILEILNTDSEHCEQLLDTVEQVVGDIVKNGIDREALSAAINRLEFRWREGEEPKGLDRNINALSSWLYGGDPLKFVDCDAVFAILRDRLATDYYERLLADWLLDENGRAVLYMIPSHTYGSEQRAKEEQRLQDTINAMSPDEKIALIDQNRRLDEWQQKSDTAEELATLPHLPITEVSTQPICFETTETWEDGILVLRHPAKEKGIVSVNLYFSLADCTEQEIFNLSVMTNLLGILPTESTDGMVLQQRITALLGDIDYSVEAFGKADSPEKCRPFFLVTTRFLEQNRDEALALVGEILTETVFDFPDLIKEILLQGDEEFKQGIISNGHSFSVRRARAPLSAEDSVKEFATGYEAYKRLHAMLGNIDEIMPELINAFKVLQQRILCGSRLIASVTSAGDMSIDSLLSRLPKGKAAGSAELCYRFHAPSAQGIMIPAAVSYSAVSLPRITDMAVWNVLSTILSLEYLWNEIRVKGGAYGTGAGVSALGIPTFYSYRDPSPSDSFSAYQGAADFLRQYCSSQPLLEQYIISTVAKQEPLMSDSEIGTMADGLYFRGISYETRCAERKRMLALTTDDLLSAADILSQSKNRCVIGSGEALESCKKYGLAVESIG